VAFNLTLKVTFFFWQNEVISFIIKVQQSLGIQDWCCEYTA